MIEFVVASILFAIWGSPASARLCASGKPPASIKLDVQLGKVTTNNGHSSLQLGTKFGLHGKLARKRGWITRGLTKTELERRLGIRIEYRKLSGNKVCASLKNIELSIGYERFRVYVAREHRPGSCEYRTTMNHEKTHVRIYRRTLEKFVPRLKRRLGQAAKRQKPIVAASAERAQKIYLRQIEKDLQLILNEMNRTLDAKNKRIDTAKNYRREQALCPIKRR